MLGSEAAVFRRLAPRQSIWRQSRRLGRRSLMPLSRLAPLNDEFASPVMVFLDSATVLATGRSLRRSADEAQGTPPFRTLASHHCLFSVVQGNLLAAITLRNCQGP